MRDIEEKPNSTKKPWFLILSSFYIPPYFDLNHKKGVGFLKLLSEKIHPYRCMVNDKHINEPPWYLDDFSSSCILFTDTLHRFNDPEVMKALLDYQAAYILEEEKKTQPPEVLSIFKNHLGKAIIKMGNKDHLKDSELPGDAKKGFQLFQKHWVRCFEAALFEREDDLVESLVRKLESLEIKIIGGLRDAISSAIPRYEKKAAKWGEELNSHFALSGKSNMNIPSRPWTEVRVFDDDYRRAKTQFIAWWRQDYFNVKSIMIDYCLRFSAGRYTKSLERIPEEGCYPTALAALSSIFFITEEMITFMAKVLRDGPGIIVYPTPDLGAKKVGEKTPFTVLCTAMQEDPVFIKAMEGRHGACNTPYLQYTDPNRKQPMTKKIAAEAEASNPATSEPPVREQLMKLQEELALLRETVACQSNLLMMLLLQRQAELQPLNLQIMSYFPSNPQGSTFFAPHAVSKTPKRKRKKGRIATGLIQGMEREVTAITPRKALGL